MTRDSSDPTRPRFHFTPPTGWLNDPNGLAHADGLHHLFYQHNPREASWGDIEWGHAVSRDLLTWEDWPIALSPTPGGPDAAGCWSGCVVDAPEGPMLLYTAVSDFDPDTMGLSAALCFARSPDGLRTWTKGERPALEWPRERDLIGWRDPTVWREGDGWRLLLGAGLETGGGAALLYRSDDLERWEEVGLLASGNLAGVRAGDVWECPQLLAFGDRHVLTFSRLTGRAPDGTLAFVGRFDGERFEAEAGEPLDHGDAFYAPQSYEDGSGRVLMIGWLPELRSREAQLAAGWSGAMSVPRVLDLREGRLWQTPAAELEAYRGEAHALRDDELDVETALDVEVTGRATVTLEFEGETVDVLLREESVELERPGAVLSMPREPGAPLRLVLDASTLELFCAGRALTTRVYPEGRAARLSVTGPGEAVVHPLR